LVKGLEFEHAIVLDADAMDAKNLYVGDMQIEDYVIKYNW